MRRIRLSQILIACALLLPGCRPPLKITYDIPGAGQTVYVAAPDYRVATFKGSGDWEVVATVRIAGLSEEKAEFVHRNFQASEKGVEVFLRDFAPENGALLAGQYTFYFSVPGANSDQIIPGGVVVLDTDAPRIFWLATAEGGETRKQPISDSTEIVVKEDSLSLVVEDSSPCELLAGGSQLAPDRLGVFKITLAQLASSSMELEARDKAGLRTVCRPRVKWDQKPPQLKLPGSHYDITARAQYPFEFEATDDTDLDRVVLRLNGKEVPLQASAQGRWSAQLPLQQGKNVVTVEAIDKAKRRVSGERSIEYDPAKGKLACRVAGTDVPAHTADGKFFVASFECLDSFEVLVEGSFVPSREIGARETAAQKVNRRYQTGGGKLDIPLSDFLPGEESAQEGLYRFRWSIPGKEPPEGLPASSVILDRTAPKLALASASAELFDAQAGEIEAAATSGVVRVRLIDDSPPLRLSADGASETPDPEDMYSIPMGDQPVEVVAVDALGHKSVWKLRPPATVAQAAGQTAAAALAVTAAASSGPGEVAKVEPSAAKEEPSAAMKVEPSAVAVVARSVPAVEEGSQFISIEMEPGKPSRWAVPATVSKIESVPGEKGKYLVTTAQEPAALMVLVNGGAPPSASGDGSAAAEPPFLMDCHEVTVARYRKYRETTGTPWQGDLAVEFNQPDQPVVAVSWEEARAFAEWAGKELPSARQHEMAAVWDGKVLRKFPWGDDFSQGGIELRWQPGPPLVTSLVRDVSPWGAVGLAGGVREWCADEAPGRAGYRRIRGGTVVHPRTPWLPDPPLSPDLFMATREDSAMQGSKMNDLGFRCALRLQAAPEAARLETAGSGGERKE